nr:MAG: translation initiation factor 2, gamma subunit, eIF-2gamma; GTPase [Candidatus Nanosalinarum sp. J07AB56]
MTVPELNIGLVGHVDHGKCISKDESVLINNEVVTGGDLAEKAFQEGRKIGEDEEGELFEVEGLYTYSLSAESEVERKKAEVYVQDYDGALVSVETSHGRTVSLTKSHPLLVNRGGEVDWLPSHRVEQGDFIAVPNRIPLENRGVEDRQDWRERMDAKVVKPQDLEAVRRETDNFTKIHTVEQIELCRRALCLSKRRLAEKAGVSPELYYEVTGSDRQLPEEAADKLSNYVAEDQPELEGEIAVDRASRSNSNVERFEALEPGDKFAKFLAFLTAEGRMTENRLELCQRDHKEMRNEVFQYLEDSGLEVQKVSDKDFRVNSTGLCQYLSARYEIETGNSRESGIPAVVHSLEQEHKETFLRWFFSFEADVNPHANQLTLVQANKDNINRVAYLLQEFGISPRLAETSSEATNSETPQKRKYHTLTISGSRNLSRFQETIGLAPKQKRRRLHQTVTESGCASNRSIPVDMDCLETALNLLKSKNNSSGHKKGLKQREWYNGLEEARKKQALTPQMFDSISRETRKEADRIDSISTPDRTDELMDVAGVTTAEVAEELGVAETTAGRYLRGEQTEEKKLAAFEACRTIAERKKKEALGALEDLEWMFDSAVTFERVDSVSHENYSDKIVDLTVPDNHNFFAGYGGVLCHNTTLTESLSGKWTDEHSEELKKGITIQIGYADVTYYREDDGKLNVDGDGEEVRSLSLVDAPGHETLMANVLSGASIMDGALLMVAADEEVPQPQTQEHLAALDIVGVENIVVVQNKIDRVSEEQARMNHEQIQDFVEGTVAEDAPIVPVSAQFDVNIDTLLEVVDDEIPTPDRDLGKDPRMLVARSFDINRPGSDTSEVRGGVVGGSLVEGELEEGDEVVLRPGVQEDGWTEIETTVERIMHGSEPVEAARPGGLMSVETGLDPALAKSDGLSDNVLGHRGTLPDTSDSLTMEVDLMDTIAGDDGDQEVENIAEGEALMLNAGTAKSAGRVSQAGKPVRVNLSIPMCVREDDRVAISRQRGSRWRLIGYGVVASAE